MAPTKNTKKTPVTKTTKKTVKLTAKQATDHFIDLQWKLIRDAAKKNIATMECGDNCDFEVVKAGAWKTHLTNAKLSHKDNRAYQKWLDTELAAANISSDWEDCEDWEDWEDCEDLLSLDFDCNCGKCEVCVDKLSDCDGCDCGVGEACDICVSDDE